MSWKAVSDDLPETFIKTGNNKFRFNLDCAEVFIERPRPLDCQAAACSDYKHHGTIKILVGISTAGFITFLCLCYGGRA